MDRFLALDIQAFASHLVGNVKKVRAVGWRICEDFLLRILPNRQHAWWGAWPSYIPPRWHFSSRFSSISDFPDCTVDNHIPTPGLFTPLMFLGRPTHSCIQQIEIQPSPDLFVPLSLALLEVVSVIKAFWYSDSASASLRCQVLSWGTNFFLAEGEMSAWKSQTNRWICLATSSPGTTLTSFTCLWKVLRKSTFNLSPSFAWGKGDWVSP